MCIILNCLQTERTENIIKQENTALKIIYIQMQNSSQNRLNKRTYDGLTGLTSQPHRWAFPIRYVFTMMQDSTP